MEKKTLTWFSLILIFLLILPSCKKEQLGKMKKGKYEMINIRSFSDGQKDTIQCLVYGPRILDGNYYFSTEIKDQVVDKIEIKVSKRTMLVNGPFPKRVKSLMIRFYSKNFPLPGYFGGSVDSYDTQESKLIVNYTSKGTNYATLQQETVYNGSVQFNWVEP